MKLKLFLLASILLVAFSVLGQGTTKLGGLPAKKIAEFNDGRACSYYLVYNPDLYGTSEEGLWMLVKVTGKQKIRKTISNPYDIEGMDMVKDAKLIGSSIYVINTSYRQGDNVACLNTKTGKWTNPVKSCAQCKFLAGNKMLVKYAHPRADGKGYTFTEKTIILK